MTFKTLLKTALGVVLTASLAFSANAAFAKKNTYEGQFTDVKETSWYKNDVASAYELGFVKGTSDTLYSPNSSVSVAEAITMASRVHAEYNGKTITETSGGKWYDAYVNYAKNNGIITNISLTPLQEKLNATKWLRFSMMPWEVNISQR